MARFLSIVSPLLLLSLLVVPLIGAQESKPPTLTLKKFDRLPDPSPELRMELFQFDENYRHGSPERFVELEKRAEELAKQYSENDDQARIWYQVAHVAAQSEVRKHAELVRKEGAKCLAISRDPLQRGRMYSYLASAVDLTGVAFPEGRREAAEILLTGYREMLAQELPEVAPALPGVNKFDIDGPAEAMARAQHFAQMAARQEAEFISDQVEIRDILVLQLRDLFKPEPKYHGHNPEGPEELRTLASKMLTEEQVKVLLENVMRKK